MVDRKIPITFYDGRETMCPPQGREVPFKYCRTEGGDLPCKNILACWWEKFDVADFIGRHFSPADIGRLLGPQRDKLASLVELVRQAAGADDEPAE